LDVATVLGESTCADKYEYEYNYSNKYIYTMQKNTNNYSVQFINGFSKNLNSKKGKIADKNNDKVIKNNKFNTNQNTNKNSGNKLNEIVTSKHGFDGFIVYPESSYNLLYVDDNCDKGSKNIDNDYYNKNVHNNIIDNNDSSNGNNETKNDIINDSNETTKVTISDMLPYSYNSLAGKYQVNITRFDTRGQIHRISGPGYSPGSKLSGDGLSGGEYPSIGMYIHIYMQNMHKYLYLHI
jgi:hypothetical protein